MANMGRQGQGSSTILDFILNTIVAIKKFTWETKVI